MILVILTSYILLPFIYLFIIYFSSILSADFFVYMILIIKIKSKKKNHNYFLTVIFRPLAVCVCNCRLGWRRWSSFDQLVICLLQQHIMKWTCLDKIMNCKYSLNHTFVALNRRPVRARLLHMQSVTARCRYLHIFSHNITLCLLL